MVLMRAESVSPFQVCFMAQFRLFMNGELKQTLYLMLEFIQRSRVFMVLRKASYCLLI